MTVSVAPTVLAVVPVVVQIVGVVLLNVTGLPLCPPEAARVMVLPAPWLRLAGRVKPVMVWAALLMVMLWVIGGAGA